MNGREDPAPSEDGTGGPVPVRQRRGLGGLLLVLGRLAVGLGTLSGAHAYQSLRGNGTVRAPWWQVAIEMVLMTVLLWAGGWAIRQGNRHQALVLRSLDDVSDDETMVLFLRSFADDAGFAAIPSGPERAPWATTTDTEEQQIAHALAPFGRMVAMGRPGEQLPQAGALRHYSPHDDWQAKVLAALERASLVLVASGTGQSLRWEVEQVVARGRPERLVLIGVNTREQYQSFREGVQDLFPKGLPDSGDWPSVHYDPHSGGRDAYTRTAIWFDADWTPHPTALGCGDPGVRTRRLIRHHRWVETAFPLAIRPVYLRAGVDIPGVPSRPLPRPWPVHLSVSLLALLWGAAMVSMTMGASHGWVQGASHGWVLLLGLATVAGVLYGVWCGEYYLTFGTVFFACLPGLLVFLAYALGLLQDSRPVIIPALSGGRLVFATGSLCSVAAGLLLLRRDVREWGASRALVRPPGDEPSDNPNGTRAEDRPPSVLVFVAVLGVVTLALLLAAFFA